MFWNATAVCTQRHWQWSTWNRVRTPITSSRSWRTTPAKGTSSRSLWECSWKKTSFLGGILAI